MNRRILDTNVVVRFLVRDNPRQAQIAATLFGACDRGELQLSLLSPVLAECVFVLESFYRHSRADIAKVLLDLIASPGIETASENRDALERYAHSKAHFVDCLVAARAVACGCPVASFDADFRAFSDVVVRLTASQVGPTRLPD